MGKTKFRINYNLFRIFHCRVEGKGVTRLSVCLLLYARLRSYFTYIYKLSIYLYKQQIFVFENWILSDKIKYIKIIKF